MLFLNIVATVWIGPWVTNVMMKRNEAEKNKQPIAGALAKEFGVSHGISSSINLIIIIAGTIYPSIRQQGVLTSKIFSLYI
jgi:hypothetical protein